jgi:hypothetical protein
VFVVLSWKSFLLVVCDSVFGVWCLVFGVWCLVFGVCEVEKVFWVYMFGVCRFELEKFFVSSV